MTKGHEEETGMLGYGGWVLSMGRGMLPLSVIPWAFCRLITYRSLRAPPRAARPGNSGPE